jgi:hypothetical protein
MHTVCELDRISKGTDKGLDSHGFTNLYDRFFKDLRSSALKVFEIGILDGNSLRMWKQYFLRAQVYGLDIDDKKNVDEERIITIVGDSSDRALLRYATEITGRDIDILIDDGSHLMGDQQIALGYLFQFVRPGGFYVIEDLHTSLERGFFDVDREGGNSTLEMLTRYIMGIPPRFISEYMSPAEVAYIDSNIEFINLFYRNHGDRCSITAILKKRLVEIAITSAFKPFEYNESERGATSY